MTTYLHYLDVVKEKLKEKNYHEAEKHLAFALRENKNGYEAFYLLGTSYHDQGKFDRAISAYKKALLLKPNFTEAALSLSILYNDLGRYEEGRLVFNRAKSQVSSTEDIQDSYIYEQLAEKHLELGTLYEKYLRFEDAKEEYNKALKLTPQNPEVSLHMARLYEKQGNFQESMKELKKLKTIDPTYVPALIRLGLSYYAQGRMIDAVQEWEKVLDIDHKNSDALMYLDMAQKAMTTTV